MIGTIFKNNMREKTLSRFIGLAILLGVVSYILGHSDLLSDADLKIQFRYVFMWALGVTPLLIMVKIVSRLSLEALKGTRLSTLEGMFMLYYLFLSKEAREAWRAYIEEQKAKETK